MKNSVRLREEVSDLKARFVGSGQIAARMYEKNDGSNEISRIWSEWLGKKFSNDEDKVKVLDHDFGAQKRVWGFHFPSQSGEPVEEKVLPLKVNKRGSSKSSCNNLEPCKLI
ncbi:hypothetical protein OIU78_026875 [Salix suchowensis]|nr:hypothetical protein OIU78_026875 [Salix suchowensis]